MSPALANDASWSFVRRFGFRFVFAYLILYSLPWPLGWIPGTANVAALYEAGSDWLLRWFGSSLLGVDAGKLEPFMTGSGDTTRAFVTLPLQLTLALGTAVLWSLFDRRGAHPRLADLLRTWLRYVLAAAMLGYGTAKWFDGQFPAIGAYGMLSTWGDSSPMGVVWKFMGASPAYTAFSGVVECLGGVLLLWRRTATLGALVTAGAMTNVVLINFCYDVPVKLYSLHLLLMAFVVLLRDLPRLAAVLVWNRPAEAVPLRLPTRPAVFWPLRIVKVAVVGWLLVGSTIGVVSRWRGEKKPASPFAETYEVVEFVRDGVVVPPLLTNATRWRHALFVYGRLIVQMTDGKTSRVYIADVGADKGTVKLAKVRGPNSADTSTDPELTFRFEDDAASAVAMPVEAAASRSANPASDPATTVAPVAGTARTLVLEGPYEGGTLAVRLRELAAESFPLRQRGFRWIQEYPYNR